jgi:hypothetical protein
MNRGNLQKIYLIEKIAVMNHPLCEWLGKEGVKSEA